MKCVACTYVAQSVPKVLACFTIRRFVGKLVIWPDLHWFNFMQYSTLNTINKYNKAVPPSVAMMFCCMKYLLF